MAKAARKRKKDDEDEEFEFPEFDEEEYLRKEIDLAKATFLSIGFAIPVALLLFELTLSGITIVAFFLGLGITFAMPRIFPFVPWPKVDWKRFERKDWIGQGSVFLFAWLAFWILLVNVPFADVTPPVIANVTVADAFKTTVSPAPGVQSDAVRNGTVWINATVYENAGIDNVTISVGGVEHVPVALPGSVYSLRLVVLPGGPQVEIRARDSAQLVAAFGFTLKVV
ncbi:MAG: hypothetical protein E6K18_07455 [Methanobacteriota archaeon]|nr:MAG: hypothetical protein E6K18_07455 [Euryarchaeota archaeon]